MHCSAYSSERRIINKINSSDKDADKRHSEMMAAFNRMAEAIETNTQEVKLLREIIEPKTIKKTKSIG